MEIFFPSSIVQIFTEHLLHVKVLDTEDMDTLDDSWLYKLRHLHANI